MLRILPDNTPWVLSSVFLNWSVTLPKLESPTYPIIVPIADIYIYIYIWYLKIDATH